MYNAKKGRAFYFNSFEKCGNPIDGCDSKLKNAVQVRGLVVIDSPTELKVSQKLDFQHKINV